MEVVTLHNKNQEISQFLAPSELRGYEQNPMLVSHHTFHHFRCSNTGSLSSNTTT